MSNERKITFRVWSGFRLEGLEDRLVRIRRKIPLHPSILQDNCNAALGSSLVQARGMAWHGLAD